MDEAVIDELMKRDYRTEIRAADGKVLVSLPELGLMAEAAGADAALAGLEAKKRAHFEAFAAADSISAIPMPASPAEARRDAPLKVFVAKAAIVTFFAVFFVFAANIMFTYTLGAVPLEYAKKVSRIGLDKGSAVLHQLAEGGVVTGARRQQLQQAVRDAVTVLKPFAAELAPLMPPAPVCAPADAKPSG